MPVNCCIPRCKSSRDLHLPDLKISFHKLPSRLEDKEQWIETIKKNCNYEVKKTSYVCSLHFQADCFQYGGLCVNRMLKKGSVPTIFFSDLKLEENKNEVKTESNINTMISYPEQKPRRMPLESTALSIQNRIYSCTVVQSRCNKYTQTVEYKDSCDNSLININRIHLINLDLAQIECSPQVKYLLQRAKKEIIENRRRIRTLQMNKYRLLKRVKGFKLLLKNSRKKDSMTPAKSSALDKTANFVKRVKRATLV